VSLSINLFKFALLYSTLYAAFGVASPFLPELLSLHGADPERLGLTLSLATMIRLISAPLAGRIADRFHALRIVLAICAALGAAVALVFLPAVGFPPLLSVALLHAAMLAPTTVLADALALWAANTSLPTRFRFEYGWVRGLGSLAFILGSLTIGQTIQGFGIGSIVIAGKAASGGRPGAALRSVPAATITRGLERSAARACSRKWDGSARCCTW
jgi:PPP family 3-phenylpropionic acid transporter